MSKLRLNQLSPLDDSVTLNVSELVSQATLKGNETVGGDSLIGVVQPFTGAVPRTQRDKNYDVLNVMDFGATWDGTLKPLSSRYSSLVSAKNDYPFVTSLSDPIDWAALQAAVNAALTLPYGATIVVPRGKGVLGTKTVTGSLNGFKGIRFEGQGQDITQIKCSGSGSGINLSYTGSGWWIDASSANAVTFCDMSFVTDQVNSGDAISINGGALSGRPTRGTYLDRVAFRGESTLEQCFARAMNLVNTTYVFHNSCRFLQSLTGGKGIGFYARVVSDDSSNSQVCGGFYFNQCEFIYGEAGIDLSSYTEGVYLTNCVSDGGIQYGVRWISDTAESGLQVMGGQFSSSLCSFRIHNIIHGCITGADIRTNGSNASWRGINMSASHGFNISGNNFIGANLSGLIGILIDQNSFGSTYSTLIASNRFESMDYAAYFTSAATNNTFDSSNLCSGVSVPAFDQVTYQNIIINRVYTYTLSVAFSGGAATESKNISIPANFFPSSKKAQCVFAKGADNDLVGTYLSTDSGNTAVNAVVSFRLITGGNIPAGTYKIMFQIS